MTGSDSITTTAGTSDNDDDPIMTQLMSKLAELMDSVCETVLQRPNGQCDLPEGVAPTLIVAGIVFVLLPSLWFCWLGGLNMFRVRRVRRLDSGATRGGVRSGGSGKRVDKSGGSCATDSTSTSSGSGHRSQDSESPEVRRRRGRPDSPDENDARPARGVSGYYIVTASGKLVPRP